MNNIIVGLISGIAGFVSGSGVTEWFHRGKDRRVDEIEKAVVTFHNNESFKQITDMEKRDAISDRFISIIEKAYRTKTKDAIFIMNAELGILYSGIECIVSSNDSHTEEPVEMVIHVTEVDNDDNLTDDFEPVAENTDDDYREVILDDRYICTENHEVIHENYNEVTEEAATGEDMSEEEQSSVQTPEDVPVEDDEDYDDDKVNHALEETPEDDVDDAKFSALIMSHVRPLIEKFGDRFEDRLVRMADRLASTYVNESVYNEYTGKLMAILKYQTGEKGERKLENLMDRFFSLFPRDAELFSK